MTREPIVSSHVYAIGHDPERNVLAVEFRENRLGLRAVWEYHGVDAEAYASLRAAESVGRAFIGVRESCVGVLVALVDPKTGVETAMEPAQLQEPAR